MRLTPLVSKYRDSRRLPTNSAADLSMEAAVRGSPDKPVNGLVASPVWLVLHVANGPEVVLSIHLSTPQHQFGITAPGFWNLSFF